MNEIKVTFPKPCDEDWEGMAPAGCHRHCAACDKVIHDLEQMTSAQAQDLLDSGEEACVRAKFGPDGVVALADRGQSGAVKLRAAAIGTAATLALAACGATTKSPQRGFWVYDVSAQSTVAGTLKSSDAGSEVVLVGNGKTFANESSMPNQFQFTDIAPGFYNLEIGEPEGYCDNQRVALVEVAEEKTFISKVEWRHSCIIVGKMEPASPPERA